MRAQSAKSIAVVSGVGVQRTEQRDVPRDLDLCEEPPVSNTASPDPSAFMIKTFGSTIRDLSFNRLPTVIQKAKAAIPEDDVVGFLLRALYRPLRMTGLIFCNRLSLSPPGLPAHTPTVVRRFHRDGYLVVEADTGGWFVVAHHYFANGAIRPFFEVH